MRNLKSETEVRKSQVNDHKPFNQSANGFKKLLFTATILLAALMVHAQSIEQQAEQVGNETYIGAMIRNIMIIAGIFLVSSMLRSGRKNKENQRP